MSWRACRAITQLQKQVNAAYPNRDKSSDGVIGDASHSSRSSDHNPNAAGVVCAVDFTDEHGEGFEAWELAEAIKDDPRVHYVIHDRKIYNASISRAWRPYSGSSPHTEHVHISFWQKPELYDDGRPFAYPAVTEPPVYKVYGIEGRVTQVRLRDKLFEAALIALCKLHQRSLFETKAANVSPKWPSGWYRKA